GAAGTDAFQRERRAVAAGTVGEARLRLRDAGFAGLVALVTVAAFTPALRNGFVDLDDEANFVANPSYRGLGVAHLRWMFTTVHLGHWQPLTWITLGLDF